MDELIIRNGRIINEGRSFYGDILLKDGRIEKIEGSIHKPCKNELDATGLIVIPGIIDDQVHFREPGLTHKADIKTESGAAVAGGVTSYMEMPNTIPPTLTQELLRQKYERATSSSAANYSFYMGVSNENLDEVLRTDSAHVCGVKVFMGSSTGNMLVDNPATLEKLFSNCQMLIAAHCEDESTIRKNLVDWTKSSGELDTSYHPLIRSVEGCYLSSSLAVALAQRFGTRLHILHISTGKELTLFNHDLPLEEKRITSEVCVHHLYFDDQDYHLLGNRIKCNPAIKSKSDKDKLFEGMIQNVLDVIATDHAPHTMEEKDRPYLEAPSGIPLIQHSLPVMMSFYHQGRITLERIVEKMCHAPAICFRIRERGFIQEGYWGDLVIVDPDLEWRVDTDNILYKCGWSPFIGKTFRGKVKHTLVNGQIVFTNNNVVPGIYGRRLEFNI